MLHLLFTIIIAEMATIMLLLFRTPLRKLVILGLDRMKRGRGPVIVTTVGGTLLVLLVSTVSGIVSIQQREEVEPGSINPTDQVIFMRALLDASLMGFILFLGLMMDRLHHYIRELRLLRKTMEAAKKQTRSFDDAKNGNEGVKAIEEEVAFLKTKIKTLESESAAKSDVAKAAESTSEALKKQSDQLLSEYDRLLEENQNLKSQLESGGKKNM